MHPNYRTARSHAEEARSLACDLLRKIDDADAGEGSDSDLEQLTAAINRNLIAIEHAIHTPRATTSANRLDMTANALVENTINSAASAEHAQDLLDEIRSYRRRATANGENQAEQDQQIAWHLENALAANLEHDTSRSPEARK